MAMILNILLIVLNFRYLASEYMHMAPVPNYGEVMHLQPVYKEDVAKSPQDLIKNETSPLGGKILSMTCLACCKLNHSLRICDNRRICETATCEKYMKRLEKISSENSNSRVGRQRQFAYDGFPMLTIYDKNSRCRSLHPNISDIRYLAAPLTTECIFYCVSPTLYESYVHTEYNGAPCPGHAVSSDSEFYNVCWSGTCREKGDTLDYIRCRAKFPTRAVQALVKLDCQIVCQTQDDSQIWIFEKQNSPRCETPFWLPRKQDPNSAFQ